MKDPISRRQALKGFAVLAGAAGVFMTRRSAEAAAALPHLPLTYPTATALGYVEDASKADKQKFPVYKPGEVCKGCVHYTGHAGDAYGPCDIYPGYVVNAGGWCSGYMKRG